MSETTREPRSRMLKSAKIVLNNGASVIDCTVRNLSAGGACLSIESVVGVPEEFRLALGESTPKPCRVAWRAENRIGVRFV